MLEAAYGVTAAIPGTPQQLRAAPSGGALYPLELYVASLRVPGLEGALFHYDPLRHGLELLRPIGADDSVGALTPYPELLVECSAFVVVTAVFWRSRFKYGQRAYRFALLEAGRREHVTRADEVAEARGERLHLGPRSGRYRHGRTLGGQPGRDGPPEPPARAGDDRHLPLQFGIHVRPPAVPALSTARASHPQ